MPQPISLCVLASAKARAHNLRIVVLLDKGAHTVFVLRHNRCKGDSRRHTRRNPQPGAQADDGIEHGAGGARQRARLRSASGTARLPPRPMKCSTIGFESTHLRPARSARQHMPHVEPPFVRAWAAIADDRVVFGPITIR